MTNDKFLKTILNRIDLLEKRTLILYNMINENTSSGLKVGTVNSSSFITKGEISGYDVIFSQPLSNNNYKVALTIIDLQTTQNDFYNLVLNARNKTINGFTIDAEMDISNLSLEIDWTVIPL
jgi:hypothetical protein